MVEIIDNYPEFIFQNRRDLLRRKIELIAKNTKSGDTYIRALIKRHPEMFLKSWASMEAKVNYIFKQLGKTLATEKTFPLLLYLSYNKVIKPRCELLKDKLKYFELENVLPLTDEQFCLTYGISIEDLEKKKAERPDREEKDILWQYVPGI